MEINVKIVFDTHLYAASSTIDDVIN